LTAIRPSSEKAGNTTPQVRTLKLPVEAAARWLHRHDPKRKKEHNRQRRADAKARKQAEANPALVGRYQRLMLRGRRP
jgi:hypothetical protein